MGFCVSAWAATRRGGLALLLGTLLDPATVWATPQGPSGGFVGWLPLDGVRATRAAVLADGRLVVVDALAGTLQLVDRSGKTLWRRFGRGTAVSVAVRDREIYVLERGARRISIWDDTGELVRVIPCPGTTPNDIAPGPLPGQLMVSDTGAGRILVLEATTGALVRSIGQGVLSFPIGLAVNGESIAVADAGLRRLVLFAPDGSVRATLGSDSSLARPHGLAWDVPGARLLVADSFSGQLVVIGEDGTVGGTLGGFGTGPGEVRNPADVDLAPGGLLAVCSGQTGRLAYYQLTPQPLAPPTAFHAGDRVGDEGGAIGTGWTVSADDPRRVRGYRLERAEGESGVFSNLAALPPGTRSHPDLGVVDGVCYRYRLVATDGLSESTSQETPCAFARNDLPPPSPDAVVAEAQDPNTVVVSWGGVAAPDLAAYVVELAGSETVRTQRLGIQVRQAAFGDLLPDRGYLVAVRAVDVAENLSPAAQTSVITYPDEDPPQPTKVAVRDTGAGGTLELTWSTAPGRVPAARFRVTAAPEVAGWPVVETEGPEPRSTLAGLVNRLPYVVTVVSVAPWGRASEPSVPVKAAPTAPARTLPLLRAAGWDGVVGLADAAGVAVMLAPETNERTLRFEYRCRGGAASVRLDGHLVPPPLLDTAGQWLPAAVTLKDGLLAGKQGHVLELLNTSFPDPLAEVAFRRVDYMPMRVTGLRPEPFNTVLDLVWQWPDARRDLTVSLWDATGAGRDGPTRPRRRIPCPVPWMGRCRDPFRPNDQISSYQLAAVSPAGWAGPAVRALGRAQFAEEPPPVTDLMVGEEVEDGVPMGWRLTWTPLSTALGPKEPPAPVQAYRIYRSAEGMEPVLLLEVAAPPALLPADAFDPGAGTLLVRSVDASGRESR